MAKGFGLFCYAILGFLTVIILGGGLGIGPVFVLLGQPAIAWTGIGVGLLLAILTFSLRWRLGLPATVFFEQVLIVMSVIVFFWACGFWAARSLRDVENYTGNHDTYVQKLPQEMTPNNLREQMEELYNRVRERYKL